MVFELIVKAQSLVSAAKRQLVDATESTTQHGHQQPFVLVRVNFFLGKVIVVLGWIQPVLNVLAIGTNQAARSRNAV